MLDIRDFTERTSSYELFTHIYWRIVNRRLVSFGKLVDYMAGVPEGPKKNYALKAAFRLIREIYWGFFRDLDPKAYPILWNQLTRPHPTYPFAGELKRIMTITDIYCAFVDIHDYTAFCQKAGRNSSMLRLLDICIENDVRQICRDNHVVSNRARGDEIIMISTSAYDITNAVVMIADYLGNRRLTKDTEIVKKRRDDVMKLPELSVSAGIAGGKKYTSLVITSAGDLSGTVVNTAARLQSRANIISSETSRILMTQNVRIKYEKEAGKRFAPMFNDSELAFLDLGPVSFKGVELRLTEAIINPDEMYRLNCREHMETLIDALKIEHWQEKIFLSMIDLIIQAFKMMSDFETDLPMDDEGLLTLNNATILNLSYTARDRFSIEGDYSSAVNTLSRIADYMALVPDIDHFLLLYTHAVVSQYNRLLEIYDKNIEIFTEKNQSRLFSQTEQRKFKDSRVASSIHDMMKSTLTSRIDADKKKLLWRRLVKDHKTSGNRVLHLGK